MNSRYRDEVIRALDGADVAWRYLIKSDIDAGWSTPLSTTQAAVFIVGIKPPDMQSAWANGTAIIQPDNAIQRTSVFQAFQYSGPILMLADAVALAQAAGIEPDTLLIDSLAQNAAQPTEIGDEQPLGMLATRQQLIAAFGSFTDMDRSWFKNVTDTPALLKARKVAGRGGRNNAEPHFCPYEVMQWLVDQKRKKGKPIGKETGWRVLKNQFPLAYAPHSDYDPNNHV